MSSTSALNSLLSSSSSPTTSSSSLDLGDILAAASGSSSPGIDVSAAVNAALYAARAPERIWQAQQATLSAQTTALSSIQTATTALTTDLTNLNSLTGPLSARTVASSNTSAVTATAASGTTAGSHTVSVSSLATTAAWYSDLASSQSAALPAGSFTLTTKSGSSATFTTGSNGVNSLTTLASSINSASLGVTASVVSDSTGARLAIISKTSGAAADFTITSAPTTTTAWASQSVPSQTSALGADSFTITTGGTTSTINVTAGQTFAQVASGINSQNLGVTASVVSDANGYHLNIASSDGTTPFTISEPAFGFSQANVGANASLTVDGVPISSASNTVTGTISGVTLNLLAPTNAATPASLTVAADTNAVSTAVTQLVTDYNSAMTLINQQFGYSSASGSQGVLGSDPTLRSLQNAMLSVLNYTSTPTSGTTTVSNLSALGITAGTDGTLALNTATLANTLSTNASDVQNFLQGAALNGFAASFNTALSTFTSAGTGAFTVELSSLKSSNSAITQQISDFEDLYIANQQTVLTAMYSKAEIALQQLPTQMKQLQAQLGQGSSS